MATYVYVNDAGGNTWQVGVNNNGTLDINPVAQQSPAPIYFNDVDSGTTTWQLAITTDGTLGGTPVPADPSQVDFITLQSPAGYFWEIQIHQTGVLFQTSADTPGPLPGLPCGIPGNVTILAGGQLNVTIPTDVSATGSPVLLATPIYQYANLDLPFSPNDPGLYYTYQNTSFRATTLAARFFNLLDEYSDPLFLNLGSSSNGTGPNGPGGPVSICLDVRAFGAVGDGIHDDTAAVQSALDQAAMNYRSLVAAGLATQNATFGITGNIVPLTASGSTVFPIGASGTIGSTVVCIPSGVYPRVYPRTPDNPPVIPADNMVGFSALQIDDGVTLQVDGGLILGYDLAVLEAQLTANKSLQLGRYCTMWILRNKNAFAEGPIGPMADTPEPQPSLEYALSNWELGPRNTGIRVTGIGFFDCGAASNTTMFQTGGWWNELRGGAIRFLKCDQSQIDTITVQNYNDIPSIYWGHSQGVTLNDVVVQHSYGGAVFNGAIGNCSPPTSLPVPGVEAGVVPLGTSYIGGLYYLPPGYLPGEDLPSYNYTVLGDLYTGNDGQPTNVFVMYRGDNAGTGSAPVDVTSIQDNLGNTFQLIGGPIVAEDQPTDMFPMGNPNYDVTMSLYAAYLKNGIPSGYEVTVNLNTTVTQSTHIPNNGFINVWLTSVVNAGPVDNVATVAEVNGVGAPSILTTEDEIILAFHPAYAVSPPDFGVNAAVSQDGDNIIVGWGSLNFHMLAPPGTYTSQWTEPVPNYTFMSAIAAMPAQGPPTGTVMNYANQAEFKYFGIVVDVLRNSTVYGNRFLDNNSAIGEFACATTEIHDNIVNQGGTPPYGAHYATDMGMLYEWTFAGEFNMNGNRYGDQISNNRGMVWTPDMWIPTAINQRVMAPTTYLEGDHLWLAVPKGQSSYNATNTGIPGYPFYAGVTGDTEPDWASPSSTLTDTSYYIFGNFSSPFPWPVVLDAVMPVSGALVGFWSQAQPSASGPYFVLPTSDPNWGNDYWMQNFTGSSSVTVFKNGVALVQGVDWSPGLEGNYFPDFIQFSPSFTANPNDVITVDMNTQIMWIDLGVGYITYPNVAPAFFINGGQGSGQTMLGFRTWGNQFAANYLDGIGFQGLDHGLINETQFLNNNGAGVRDVSSLYCNMVPSIGMTITGNYAIGNTGPSLDFTPGTEWTVDNPEIDPNTDIRNGVSNIINQNPQNPTAG
jgi:hypothetical protein